MNKEGYLVIVLIVFLIVIPMFVLSNDPVSPVNIQTGPSSRRPDGSAKSVQAQAGNVTELFINATVITKTWQGYYGNVTGKVTLQNSNNQSMYDWSFANPEGEVYAVNQSVSDWSNIKCFNYSAKSPEVNLSSLESYLGLSSNSVDGVDETFTSKTHPSFYVGSTQIVANRCWSTQTYSNSGSGTNFYEVLLTDTTDNLVVYAGLINSSVTGFDGSPHDFQMLVGVNGHDGAAAVQQYYFYVELF